MKPSGSEPLYQTWAQQAIALPTGVAQIGTLQYKWNAGADHVCSQRYVLYVGKQGLYLRTYVRRLWSTVLTAHTLTLLALLHVHYNWVRQIHYTGHSDICTDGITIVLPLQGDTGDGTYEEQINTKTALMQGGIQYS